MGDFIMNARNGGFLMDAGNGRLYNGCKKWGILKFMVGI